MHFNLNGFFARLFGENPQDLKDCTFIYTSDHGESFGEYGYWLHGHKWFEQALVPFVIFSTNNWVLENLKKPGEIPGTLSHLNIYPTLRSIIFHDLDYASGEYNSLVSSKEWKNPPLFYLKLGQASEPIPTDENGKMILSVEKYMY